MASKVKAVPDGYGGVTAYICVNDGAKALEFYKRAFGAEETMRMADPSGKIGHAEMLIAGAVVMLADEFADMGYKSPRSLGGSPVTLMFYVPDVDALVKRAVAAGAKLVRPVENQFYGDRSGKLEDPFGHVWMIATHVEDVPPAEMSRRAKELYGMS